MKLLDLPDCMLEEILGYLSYDEIAKKRMVSTKFDKIAQGLLNIGFNKMMKQHTLNLKKMKSILPRRESERRVHVLAKHADILTCIETRISMMSMTYTKYMDLGLCCFIPGKIIDEVMTILKLVDSTHQPLRTHEVLQELRDISSMATDHFDEKIAPHLKKSFSELSNLKYGSSMYQIIQAPIEPVLEMGPEISSEQLQAPNRAQTEHRCKGAQSNRVSIVRLERRCQNIMKCVQQAKKLQRKQSRLIRNHQLYIIELKTEMAEYRRRLEDITGCTSASQSPIQPVSSSTIHATAESIESLGSTSTSSGSLSTVISKPTAPKPALAEPHQLWASTRSETTYNNIKPRMATILIKRRFEDAKDTLNRSSKCARTESHDGED